MTIYLIWEKYEDSPWGYYTNEQKMKEALDQLNTPFTPPVYGYYYTEVETDD